MYLIVVYDVAVERVNAVKKYLRTQLTWIQNSVFEGEVTPSQFEEIKSEIKNLIDENHDSVIFYIMKYPNFKKEVMGVEKGSVENIL
ncbi:MAG: CRISPR-associated endonuclease Cas2 [Candidatus Asgardarchaeum sp.]|nr:CRISPR-associated endonuclease Cas2 [Candidatus Odinarchaeota archaeon]